MKNNRISKMGIVLVCMGVLITVVFMAAVCLERIGTVSLVRSAILLEEPVLLPENEGKIVILQGTLTSEAKVQEPIFGFAFDAPVVECITQIYKGYRTAGPHGTGGMEWDWKNQDTAVYISAALMGEFELDPRLLAQVPTHVEVKTSELAAMGIEHLFVAGEGDTAYFSTVDIRDMRVTSNYVNGTRDAGTLRYAYRLPKTDQTYTVIGIQEEGKLRLIEDIGDASLRVGAVGAQGIIDGLDYTWLSVMMVVFVISFILIFFGVQAIIQRRKNAIAKEQKAMDRAAKTHRNKQRKP